MTIEEITEKYNNIKDKKYISGLIKILDNKKLSDYQKIQLVKPLLSIHNSKRFKQAINVKVNKHTRAGQQGKKIYCPVCKESNRVYHFSWSALSCGNCKKMVNKYDFYIKLR